MSYDILIINGKVVDGTGNPWFKADIGLCPIISVNSHDLDEKAIIPPR